MILQRMALTTFMFFAATASFQLVSTGKDDSHYCDKVETIKPNLTLYEEQVVKGRIVDFSGDPFKGTAVELRRLKPHNKHEILKRVTTDQDGNFSLGLLAKGKYRLLASQDRLFKQPDSLVCSPKKDCFLNVKLRVTGTDMPESFCPIR